MMRVGVLFGGVSSEREASLASGRQVYMHLNRQKNIPIPIFVDTENRFRELPKKLIVQNTTSDIIARLEKEAKRIAYEELKSLIDFAFIALHGKYGDDGCIRGLLELLGIPYTGSGVLAAAIGMDKHMTLCILATAGISVPRHLAISEKAWQERREEMQKEIEETLGYPCVVKPTREECSTGLSVVREEEQLAPPMEKAFQWDTTCLVKELLRGRRLPAE